MKRSAVFPLFLAAASCRSLKATPGSPWLALQHRAESMHVAMASTAPSGDADVDFVRLMLLHHQAAVEMARIQLAHGGDPQIQRLAQEIVTDQQSEIDLMRLWLTRHAHSEPK
jgi:uncharacterized protein (DUF305 family)